MAFLSLYERSFLDKESLKNLAAISSETYRVDVSCEGHVSRPYGKNLFSILWRTTTGFSASDLSSIDKLLHRIYLAHAIRVDNYAKLLQDALVGVKRLKNLYRLEGRGEVEQALEKTTRIGKKILSHMEIIEKEYPNLIQKEKNPFHHFFYYQKKMEIFLKIHALKSEEIEFIENCQTAMDQGIQLMYDNFFSKKNSCEILKQCLKASKFGILFPLNYRDKTSEMNKIIPIGIRKKDQHDLLFITYYGNLFSSDESFYPPIFSLLSLEPSLSSLFSLTKDVLFSGSRVESRITYGPYSYEEVINLLCLHDLFFNKRLTPYKKEEAIKNFKMLFDPIKRLPPSALGKSSKKTSQMGPEILWLSDVCQRQRNEEFFKLLESFYAFGEECEEKIRVSQEGVLSEEVLSFKSLEKPEEGLEEGFIDISADKSMIV